MSFGQEGAQQSGRVPQMSGSCSALRTSAPRRRPAALPSPPIQTRYRLAEDEHRLAGPLPGHPPASTEIYGTHSRRDIRRACVARQQSDDCEGCVLRQPGGGPRNPHWAVPPGREPSPAGPTRPAHHLLPTHQLTRPGGATQTAATTTADALFLGGYEGRPGSWCLTMTASHGPSETPSGEPLTCPLVDSNTGPPRSSGSVLSLEKFPATVNAPTR
jgi:hypothetical protein